MNQFQIAETGLTDVIYNVDGVAGNVLPEELVVNLDKWDQSDLQFPAICSYLSNAPKQEAVKLWVTYSKREYDMFEDFLLSLGYKLIGQCPFYTDGISVSVRKWFFLEKNNTSNERYFFPSRVNLPNLKQIPMADNFRNAPVIRYDWKKRFNSDSVVLEYGKENFVHKEGTYSFIALRNKMDMFPIYEQEKLSWFRSLLDKVIPQTRRLLKVGEEFKLVDVQKFGYIANLDFSTSPVYLGPDTCYYIDFRFPFIQTTDSLIDYDDVIVIRVPVTNELTNYLLSSMNVVIPKNGPQLLLEDDEIDIDFEEYDDPTTLYGR